MTILGVAMNDINVILADSPDLGRIRLCECNSIHMSIGPVTINLTPKAFAEAADMMSSAMDQLTAISGFERLGHGLPEPPQSRLTH